MKKLFSVLFVIIVLLLSITLFSCEFLPQTQKNPEISTAAEAIAKMEENLNEQFSFEMNNVISLNVEVSGEKINMYGDGKTIFMQNSDKQVVYYYEILNSKSTYAGITSNSTRLKAFDDGKYFLMNSEDGVTRKLTSDLSATEFNDFMAYLSEHEVDYFDGYGNSSYVKNEDGTHTIKLWQFSERCLILFNNQMSLSEEYTNGKITDYTVTITTDANFLPTNMKVDFAFSNSDFSGSEEVVFSNYGTAEAITDTLNPNDYTSVDDVRIIEILENFITEKQNSNEESFVLDSITDTSYKYQKVKVVEHDQVSYGYKDDEFFFDVDSTVNDVKNNLSYKDGVYKVNGQWQQGQGYTETEAKMFIDRLIDPFYFSAVNVSGVDVYEDASGATKYVLYLQPVGNFAESLKSIVETAGARFESQNVKMTVLMENGEITSVNTEARIVGYVYEGSIKNSLTVQMDYTVSFTVQGSQENQDNQGSSAI